MGTYRKDSIEVIDKSICLKYKDLRNHNLL